MNLKDRKAIKDIEQVQIPRVLEKQLGPLGFPDTFKVSYDFEAFKDANDNSIVALNQIDLDQPWAFANAVRSLAEADEMYREAVVGGVRELRITIGDEKACELVDGRLTLVTKLRNSNGYVDDCGSTEIRDHLLTAL